MSGTRVRNFLMVFSALAIAGLCVMTGPAPWQQGGAQAMTLDEARKIAAQRRPQYALPPRKIDDVTQVLEQARPDPENIKRLRAAADAPVPSGLGDMELAQFYMRRALAAVDLGRASQAVDDIREAWRLAKPTAMLQPRWPAFTRKPGSIPGPGFRRPSLAERVPTIQQIANRILQRYYFVEGTYGDPRLATTVYEGVRAHLLVTLPGFVTGTDAQAVRLALRVGDVEAARRSVGRMQVLTVKLKQYPQNAVYWNIWDALSEEGLGTVQLATGKVVAAEATFRRAIVHMERAVGDIKNFESVRPPSGTYEGRLSKMRVELAQSLARQGRLIEAEVETRRALIDMVRQQSDAAPTVAIIVLGLADILQAQARYRDAQRLSEAALDILVKGAVNPVHHADALQRIAVSQASQGQWDAALATFDKVKQVLAGDAVASKRFADSNLDLAVAMMRNGRAASAVPILETILKRRIAEGQPEYSLSVVRGFLGIALGAVGRTEEALRMLRNAVPVLIAAVDAPSKEEGALDEQNRRQMVIDGYVALLAQITGSEIEKRLGINAVDEAFRMADAAHAKSLQSAIAAASARAASGGAALVDLIRQAQDADQQVAALYDLLRANLEGPVDAASQQAIQALRKDIAQLQGARATLRKEIGRKFPQYEQLINPQPVGIAQAQARLQPGDALVVTYFTGAGAGYVWAVPKQGEPAFAATTAAEPAVVRLVEEVRNAVDSNATAVNEIPAFPVAAAHALYAALIEPVAAGLKDAKNIIAVPHGVLGTLPFSLLVTREVPQPQERDGVPLFAGYRDVPFLIRDATVTQVPSVAAFASLRAVAAGATTRKPFIGFGDPWFSNEQALAAQAERPIQVAMRGAALNRRAVPKTDTMASAELAQLPRLPDTADEVREVARVLHADPAADVLLGARASEKAVRSLKLDDRRVVMFATHGLVPGELDGLTQPALALSSPEVPGVEGDGLLTVDKILGLKLDADWVVLSACNTAAAAESSGAEAVSGLGRAFFYAGARALLVTHWPVETGSARALTTDLFRRQAASAELSRAASLREAMIDMIAKQERVDPASGRVEFTYAHPMFWAPFALVGDGGVGTRAQ